MLTQAEQDTLDRLIYASERDPSMPKFPVTRTYPFPVKGFSNVWLKDESTNETGTHKDRMAWEIIMTYKDILQCKRAGNNGDPLPHFSILSAGSAALAVQSKLSRFNLPNLKSLVDKDTPAEIIGYLQSIGVEVHTADLSARLLTSEDILRLTDNSQGFDITSNKGFDPSARFYDWMAYEILNLNPDYSFVPVGTAQLYENILNTMKKVATDRPASIYSGDAAATPRMHVIGATTNDPDTKATKLYAPFRPFSTLTPDWIRLYSRRGWCGKESQVMEVSEEKLEEAHGLLTSQGVPAEYSAAAGLAAFLQMKERIPQDSRILIVSTGKAKFPFAT